MENLMVKRLTQDYKELHKKFHIDYEDVDVCLEEAYKIYQRAEENKELVTKNKLYFKILYFIINIRIERIRETRDEDFDLIYFIKNAYKYIKDEYDKIQLELMEAKALNLNVFDISKNKIIKIYKKTEKYYLFLMLNKENDKKEFYKQSQNLSNLRLEFSEILQKTKDKELACLYVTKAIIGFIDLYIEKKISLNCLKDTYNRFLRIVKINNRIDDIQKIDDLLNKYDIVL